MVPAAVVEFLKSREGFKVTVYLDALGKPTAGMGHLLTAEEVKSYPVGMAVPLDVINAWAAADSLKAYPAAMAQAEVLGISNEAFIQVLTSVNFQLGTAWNTLYKKTWAFMQAGLWEKAAVEAANSAWFHQTPSRVQDFQAALRALPKTKA